MHIQLNVFAGPDKKYFMLGGKGGVGKTSSAASLAVKFATEGLPTLVVSTDPAHSLSDSFDQVSTSEDYQVRCIIRVCGLLQQLF